MVGSSSPTLTWSRLGISLGTIEVIPGKLVAAPHRILRACHGKLIAQTYMSICLFR